ncbi:MAG UNVERIFIED_CONTAM: hypothetical protein LVT10_09675 [Anaerolineae bacterium]
MPDGSGDGVGVSGRSNADWGRSVMSRPLVSLLSWGGCYFEQEGDCIPRHSSSPIRWSG